MSVAVVVGTRPEIIKLAPVVQELALVTDDPAGDVEVVYTGQHYDEALAGRFFDVFGMPRPDAVVDVGGHTRGEQIGLGVQGLSRRWTTVAPDAVVVQGDTNSALAGALAANAVGVPLVHVEAGLRSHDPAMPEEHNRVLIDHISDLLLAPTIVSEKNLAEEGITDGVVVTGNTVVEAVRAMLPGRARRQAAVRARGLEPDGFVLATVHRPENTDARDRLSAVLRHLGDLDLPVVVPLHPRTRARVEQFGLEHLTARLDVIEPLGYREFLALAAEAAVLVSDSGGVQEEASVLKRPAVVVRRSTERPEVLDTFTRLATPETLGDHVAACLTGLDATLERLAGIPSPYGDGDAADLSATAIRELLV